MWKWLWNGVTGRDWKSFEMHIRRSPDCLEEIFGRNVGIKGASVRSQIELRNMLLDTGGKEVFVINWQRTWLNYICICGK